MSIIDNLSDMVTKTAKAAARKSGEMLEITRLTINMGLLEEQLMRKFTEIGKLTYDGYIKETDILESVKDYCEKVKVDQKNIKEMKEKILELKDSKECKDCGEEIELDFAYCCKCGAKQEELPVKEDIVSYKICSECATESCPEAMFCHKCGTKI